MLCICINIYVYNDIKDNNDEIIIMIMMMISNDNKNTKIPG